MSDYNCECKFVGKTFDKEFERMWIQIADELRLQHELNGLGALFQQNSTGSPCDSGFDAMWRQIGDELQREREISEFAQLFWTKLSLKGRRSRWLR